jgi:hypothetical protein
MGLPIPRYQFGNLTSDPSKHLSSVPLLASHSCPRPKRNADRSAHTRASSQLPYALAHTVLSRPLSPYPPAAYRMLEAPLQDRPRGMHCVLPRLPWAGRYETSHIPRPIFSSPSHSCEGEGERPSMRLNSLSTIGISHVKDRAVPSSHVRFPIILL